MTLELGEIYIFEVRAWIITKIRGCQNKGGLTFYIERTILLSHEGLLLSRTN